MRTALFLLLVCVAAGVARADKPYDAEADRLRQLATVAHKKAQQTQDAKLYEEAAGYYEQYFTRPDSYEAVMAFYYGELLFKLQRWAKAAEMYQRAITVEPKGKFTSEAAYAYVISTKNAINGPEDATATPPCPDMKPCAIPADRQRLIAAFDRYFDLVPASPERPAMEYRRARIWYAYQHFAEAATQFDRIFVGYPDNELATYSANLEMDCLAKLKRYDELRRLVERVKKSPVMKDAVVQQEVQQLDAELKKKGK
jgi:tetratricopeptide (TPR) repeat protein